MGIPECYYTQADWSSPTVASQRYACVAIVTVSRIRLCSISGAGSYISSVEIVVVFVRVSNLWRPLCACWHSQLHVHV